MAGPMVALVAAALAAGQFFPFPTSPLGGEGCAVDLSALSPRPAGAHGFIAIRDGHFVDGRGGPIKFFGTNLCFGACFPEHSNAERLAARLAQLGVNLVRLHHMDTSFFPRGIWDPKDKTRHTLSKEALDRLDYLVAQLIRHGIYVNVNLHVGRRPHESDPAPFADQLPLFGKGIDNFWPPLIRFQKWYARALLDRVNKYTGRKYTREPGVAFVEISNEDSLITWWLNGAIDRAPKPYQDFLDERWNEWLKKRYGTTAKLRRAWQAGAVELGPELAANGDFSRGQSGWRVQTLGTCKALAQLTGEGPGGKRCLTVQISATDAVGWHGQVLYLPVKLKAGAPYTLAIWLRANPPRSVQLIVMQAHEPWRRLGLARRVDVGRQWQKFTVHFRAAADEDNARVTITDLAKQKGTVWIGPLSLRPGGVVGLPEGQSIEKGNVARPRRRELAGRTPQAQQDIVRFYLDLEREYWQTMYDYLKRELGVRALVTGTQISYSPPYTQEMMDYADIHSYWQHPRFPGRPWDRRNWYVLNMSMVANPPGTMGRLVGHRLVGKPFTVSEYNHPLPNQYAAECFVFLAAFAAVQDWDAIYGFTYGQSDEWDATGPERYFNLRSDPVKLVTFPWAAVAVRQGGIRPAPHQMVVGASLSEAIELVLRGLRSVNALHVGADFGDLLTKRIYLRWGRRGKLREPKPLAPAAYSAGDVVWDVREKGREALIVRGKRAKALVGFCTDGAPRDLGDGVRVSIRPTSLNWATVTIANLDGPNIALPGRIVVTAAAAYRNRGWRWQEFGRGRVTLGPDWGTGPAEVEGVEAVVRLPVAASRARAWSLDCAGRRVSQLPLRAEGNAAVLEIGPQWQTLWYLLEVR